ncbi:5-methylcytosine-specific restriction protein A [Paraburkholderia atlantica]|uniref:HNH endonuclease n=1 Tax=Paraburkholderia atlantica TaxID=2654982 RepID=UPI003D196866
MTATPRTRGRRWQRIRARQLRLHPLCARCLTKGFVTEATEVDHIMPLFKGGTDAWQNLQSLCDPCHVEKTREDIERRSGGCDLSGMPNDPAHPWAAR